MRDLDLDRYSYEKLKELRDRTDATPGRYTFFFTTEEFVLYKEAGLLERGALGLSEITFLGRVVLAAYESERNHDDSTTI